MARVVLCFILTALNVGCGLLKEKPISEEPLQISQITKHPLPPEKTEELLGEVGNNWLYGEGAGSTAATVGTVVAFPPYAALVLGNAALDLAGYENVWLSDLLPQEDSENWKKGYQSVVEVPGRVNAEVAGEEFRDQSLAKKKIEQVIQSATETQKTGTQFGKPER